ATAADIAKMERYRARFTEWFSFATDGRGTIDTTLSPWTCQDGGTGSVPKPDGGSTPGDGGIMEPYDAGVPEEDAGFAPEPDDGGVPLEADAGAVHDAGRGGRDAGIGIRGPTTGCACDTTGGLPAWSAWLAAVF